MTISLQNNYIFKSKSWIRNPINAKSRIKIEPDAKDGKYSYTYFGSNHDPGPTLGLAWDTNLNLDRDPYYF